MPVSSPDGVIPMLRSDKVEGDEERKRPSNKRGHTDKWLWAKLERVSYKSAVIHFNKHMSPPFNRKVTESSHVVLVPTHMSTDPIIKHKLLST